MGWSPGCCVEFVSHAHFLSITWEEGGATQGSPLNTCVVCLCLSQVTLIHSKVQLADQELLPSVRQEVKEILLRKGVQLLLSTCDKPLLSSPHLLIHCPWPSRAAGWGCSRGSSAQAPLLPIVSREHQEVSDVGACLSCMQREVKVTGLAGPGCS